MNKKTQGVTLVEGMLAFALASLVILLGIKQYSQYKFSRDAFTLKYSVDVLFQGMRNYYNANCAESSDTDMTLHSLAPSRSPSNPFPVDIQTTLTNYLNTNWRPMATLVDSSFATKGYEIQFNNFIPSTIKNENFCYYFPNTSQTSPTCGSLPNTAAKINLWIAQVVVKIKDTKMTLALKGLTNADCALTDYQANTIVDCNSGVTAGTPAYLVWQHLPSFASPAISSGLWRSTYTVKQFNLQYTNDSYWETVSGESSNYLCGG